MNMARIHAQLARGYARRASRACGVPMVTWPAVRRDSAGEKTFLLVVEFLVCQEP